jgi:hypothetical protein
LFLTDSHCALLLPERIPLIFYDTFIASDKARGVCS